MPKFDQPITDRDEMTREVATWQAGGTATVRYTDGCEVTGPLVGSEFGRGLDIGAGLSIGFRDADGDPFEDVTALVAYDPPTILPPGNIAVPREVFQGFGPGSLRDWADTYRGALIVPAILRACAKGMEQADA